MHRPSHDARPSACCQWRNDGNPNFGGIGYGFVGLTMGSFSALEGALQSPSALGPGYGASTGGFSVGGGSGALLFGRLWVGGKGFGMFVGTGETPSGTAKLSAAGGAGELGFAAVNHGGWLVIPFVGVGSLSYSLSIQNRRATPVKLSAYDTLAAGTTTDYSASFVTGEVGVRVMRLLFGEGRHGGLAAGAELGYMSALGRGPWTGPGGVNSGIGSADLGAAYVRLLIGGGGFSFKGGDPDGASHH